MERPLAGWLAGCSWAGRRPGRRAAIRGKNLMGRAKQGAIHPADAAVRSGRCLSNGFAAVLAQSPPSARSVVTMSEIEVRASTQSSARRAALSALGPRLRPRSFCFARVAARSRAIAKLEARSSASPPSAHAWTAWV
jgi:hypothetical protein